MKELFIFMDEEECVHIVKGDKKVFEEEYVKLQNEFWDNELPDYSDFYEILDNRLYARGTEFYKTPDIFSHNGMRFYEQ